MQRWAAAAVAPDSPTLEGKSISLAILPLSFSGSFFSLLAFRQKPSARRMRLICSPFLPYIPFRRLFLSRSLFSLPFFLCTAAVITCSAPDVSIDPSPRTNKLRNIPTIPITLYQVYPSLLGSLYLCASLSAGNRPRAFASASGRDQSPIGYKGVGALVYISAINSMIIDCQ